MHSGRVPFDDPAYPTDANPLEFAVAQRDRDVISMVRKAISNKNVLMAYQPVVPSKHPDQIAFYEGLLRVLDSSGRIIPAKEFISAIENNELGRNLDCIALEAGLRTLSENPSLRLAINMSAHSIGYPSWMKTLNQGLAADDSVSERLILEITESSAMRMPELVTVFMQDLQQRGITFALDDFGAGHTSFRYLREFYFDILKIDGEFIRGISTSPDNQVLTEALLGIARHFDMFTVAEAVESAEDAAYLVQLGIDCMQGYYFGAPTIRPAWDGRKSSRRRA